MTLHERLEAFWRGEEPDRIPYTAYGFFFDNKLDDPAFRKLTADGLGLLRGTCAFKYVHNDVEIRHSSSTDDGVEIRRQTFHTPVGDVWQSHRKGWHDQYYLKTAEDYRIMTWIWEHTTIETNDPAMREWMTKLKPWDFAVSFVGRTPLQTMLVDYAGLENFGVHLFEFQDEVKALYSAMLRSFRKQVELACAGPLTYLMCLENFTAETLGPQRYAEFLLPVYEECFPAARQAGKVVGVHYDGKTKVIRELFAEAPIDVIESLTPPPEGDQTPAEARAAWPNKRFWANVNVGMYSKPARELKAYVAAMIHDGAPDGRRLALELSEDIPPNWAQSMPVVMDAIHEAAR